MNNNKKGIHIFSIITIVMEAVLFVLLLVDCHEYRNMCGKEDVGSFLLALFWVIILFVFLAIFVIVVKKKSKKPENMSKNDVLSVRKKNYVSSVVVDIVCSMAFLLISEETVFRFYVEDLSLNVFEATYIGGYYKIIKSYVLIIIVVSLIRNIVLLAALGNVPTHVSDIDRNANTDNNDSTAVTDNDYGKNIKDTSVENMSSNNSSGEQNQIY